MDLDDRINFAVESMKPIVERNDLTTKVRAGE